MSRLVTGKGPVFVTAMVYTTVDPMIGAVGACVTNTLNEVGVAGATNPVPLVNSAVLLHADPAVTKAVPDTKTGAQRAPTVPLRVNVQTAPGRRAMPLA